MLRLGDRKKKPFDSRRCDWNGETLKNRSPNRLGAIQGCPKRYDKYFNQDRMN